MDILTIQILRYLVKIIFIYQAIQDGHKVEYLGDNKFKFELLDNTNIKPKDFIKKFYPKF